MCICVHIYIYIYIYTHTCTLSLSLSLITEGGPLIIAGRAQARWLMRRPFVGKRGSKHT